MPAYPSDQLKCPFLREAFLNPPEASVSHSENKLYVFGTALTSW